jgi:hypothetical protein
MQTGYLKCGVYSSILKHLKYIFFPTLHFVHVMGLAKCVYITT